MRQKQEGNGGSAGMYLSEEKDGEEKKIGSLKELSSSF